MLVLLAKSCGLLGYHACPADEVLWAAGLSCLSCCRSLVGCWAVMLILLTKSCGLLGYHACPADEVLWAVVLVYLLS